MKKVVETVKSLSSDPIFMSELEKQQLDEYCSAMAIVDAKKEGKQEGKIEIAKKSLDENIDIETISKITGLTIDEINKL